MWSLNQNARAVARVDLAPARAAVLEVLEHLERLADDVVRRAALDVDDEADAAGVVLVRRIVQTFGFVRLQIANVRLQIRLLVTLHGAVPWKTAG